MSTTVLMIGTRKGLWVGTGDEARSHWDLRGPDELRSEVHAVAVDTRGSTPRLLMASKHWHWGPQVLRSEDLGRTWEHGPDGAIAFPEDTGRTLEAVWSLAPSPADPDVVWAGTEPSALFRSDRRGGDLRPRPRRCGTTRTASSGAPGFGGQAIHTLLPHPTDPGAAHGGDVDRRGLPHLRRRRLLGARQPGDPGHLPARGRPVPGVRPVRAQGRPRPGEPDRLYLQNHGGVYRSTDGADSWTSIADGLPSDFGFPVVAHPRKPGTIWLFPLEGADGRFPVEGTCAVWRSRDAGDTWERLTSGLPDSFFTGVMRDAMCVDDGDPAGVYFGSRDGTVFGSDDEGDTWHPVVEHLPDVLCVRAAQV